ncbi:MAG: type IV pilus assembly protein PilE [Planctomycetota bacterium]|jgi:type IV pilus assembly protein PilE
MKRNRAKGFTLIELMIVVAIIGILTSVAMAFYGNSVIAANRTEARAALNSIAGSLEKCRALYGVYNSASCTVPASVTTETGLYTVAAVRAGSTFTLTATPAKSPQTDDAACTTLTLTNTGIKGSTGSDSTECW